MKDLLLHPTTTAQWHALICEAQLSSDQRLNEDMESYLVFLLTRYMTHPELANKVLAMEFLNAMHETGSLRQTLLRDVGDQCLLFSGLFPLRADRLRVKISYFVDLGRGAYAAVSPKTQNGTAGLYEQLADCFVRLMEILHAMRELGTQEACLTSLHAIDLWHDSSSQRARQQLRRTTAGTPIVIGTGSYKYHG